MRSISGLRHVGVALSFAILAACGGATEQSPDDGSTGNPNGAGGTSSAQPPGEEASPPPRRTARPPAYRAWTQVNAERAHLFVVRADFENDTCVRANFVAPFEPATNRYKRVALPPQWNVQNLTLTPDARGCLDNEWAGEPREALDAHGSVDVELWAPNDFLPCLVTFDIDLIFPTGGDHIVFEALPVEGCRG